MCEDAGCVHKLAGISFSPYVLINLSNRLGNRMHELAGIGGLLLLLHSLQTVLKRLDHDLVK